MNSALPGVLAEIADVAGVEAAWALARAKGGTNIYVPVTADDGHWLPKLVGRAAADKICAHFQISTTGARLLIPLAKLADQQARMREAVSAGMSNNEAALAAGMHERSARRYRARARDDDDSQGKLL